MSVVGCRLSVVGCPLSVVGNKRKLWRSALRLALAHGQRTTDNGQQTTGNGQPRSRGKGGLDECHQFPEGMAQFGIVLPDSVEIAAGIVLRPKLVGEIVGKILKS